MHNVNFGVLHEFLGMSFRERKNKRREKHNRIENGERKSSFILHHSHYI